MGGCCSRQAALPSPQEVARALDDIVEASKSPQPSNLEESFEVVRRAAFNDACDDALWDSHERLLTAYAVFAARPSGEMYSDPSCAVRTLKALAYRSGHRKEIAAFPGLLEAMVSAASNLSNSRTMRGDAMWFFTNLCIQDAAEPGAVVPRMLAVPGFVSCLLSAMAEHVSEDALELFESEPVVKASGCLCTLAAVLPSVTSAIPDLLPTTGRAIVRMVTDFDFSDVNKLPQTTVALLMTQFFTFEALDIVFTLAQNKQGKEAVRNCQEVVEALYRVRGTFGLDPFVRLCCHGALINLDLEDTPQLAVSQIMPNGKMAVGFAVWPGMQDMMMQRQAMLQQLGW